MEVSDEPEGEVTAASQSALSATDAASFINRSRCALLASDFRFCLRGVREVRVLLTIALLSTVESLYLKLDIQSNTLHPLNGRDSPRHNVMVLNCVRII